MINGQKEPGGRSAGEPAIQRSVTASASKARKWGQSEKAANVCREASIGAVNAEARCNEALRVDHDALNAPMTLYGPHGSARRPELFTR